MAVAGLCLVPLLASHTRVGAAENRPVDNNARLIASPEADWPQWRGPRRDGICDETGLLQQWPEGGPRLIWKESGLGRGYSAPIIVKSRIYLTGDVGQDLRIFALDGDGRVIWQATNGAAWKTPYPGARASCTFSEGRIYHLNAHGRLACLHAENGVTLWSVDVLERFQGKNITWALSENLLVDGPRVLVTPGGDLALMAALDKQTGATIWTTPALRLGPTQDPAHQRVAGPAGEADRASYGSPILFSFGGRRHLVSSSLKHIFGVDADTGRLLWTRPLPTRYLVIATTPVLVGNGVFVTAPDAEGNGLYQFESQGPGVQVNRLWATDLDTCHGGSVLVDGTIYGAYYRRPKGWVSLNARTGEVRHVLKDLAMGSVLYADQRLYCLSQEGEAALLKPSPEGLEVAGRFRLVSERKSDVWAHPVIHQGRLYLRYHETLFCYDIRRGK